MLDERIASQPEVIRAIVSGCSPCYGVPHLAHHTAEVPGLRGRCRHLPQPKLCPAPAPCRPERSQPVSALCLLLLVLLLLAGVESHHGISGGKAGAAGPALLGLPCGDAQR